MSIYKLNLNFNHLLTHSIFKGLTEIPSLVKQVYSGKSNYTFIQLELSLLQSFTAPKDSKELEFVADKKQKLRDQLNNLLGKDVIILLPIYFYGTHESFWGECLKESHGFFTHWLECITLYKKMIT